MGKPREFGQTDGTDIGPTAACYTPSILPQIFGRADSPMPIAVLCSKCRTRFTVSDRFAGQTGPCPKCKSPITIPKPVDVVIHEPEGPAQTGAAGRMPTAPIVFREEPVSRLVVAAVVAGGLGMMAAAFLAGRIFAGRVPLLMQAPTAFLSALPCVLVGYALVRNRELEPYRGRPLILRAMICAGVYAALWAARGYLPADLEIWQWTFVAPVFLFAGALAALATLDLDWGVGVGHFSLSVAFIAMLRYLAGLPPL
jgi:hypothetical protein